MKQSNYQRHCGNCGRRNHTTRECRVIICVHCGRNNHKSEDCRFKIQGNQNNVYHKRNNNLSQNIRCPNFVKKPNPKDNRKSFPTRNSNSSSNHNKNSENSEDNYENLELLFSENHYEICINYDIDTNVESTDNIIYNKDHKTCLCLDDACLSNMCPNAF